MKKGSELSISIVFTVCLSAFILPSILIIEHFRWFLLVSLLLFANLIYALFGDVSVAIAVHWLTLMLLILLRINNVYNKSY